MNKNITCVHFRIIFVYFGPSLQLYIIKLYFCYPAWIVVVATGQSNASDSDSSISTDESSTSSENARQNNTFDSNFDYNFTRIDENNMPPPPPRMNFSSSLSVHVRNDNGDILSYFEYFFSPGLLHLIETETNRYARDHIGQHKNHSRHNKWQDTTTRKYRARARAVDLPLLPHHFD